MITINCQMCGAALTGGLDTYGPPGGELCQPCYWGLADEYKEQRRLQRIELWAKLSDYEAETEELRRQAGYDPDDDKSDIKTLIRGNEAKIDDLRKALKVL